MIYIRIDEVKMLLERKMQEVKAEKEKIVDDLQTECVISYADSLNKHKSKKNANIIKVIQMQCIKLLK